MSKEMAATDKMLQVYDAEKDRFVEVTPERHKAALHLQRQLELGTLIQALTLKQIFDARAYIDLGFTSKTEYIENALPFEKRQAYRLISIATAFQNSYPELQNVHPGGQIKALESGEFVPPGAQKPDDWMEVGVSKLYEISRLDEDALADALQSGTLKTKDGRELSIDDLKEMSKKAVAHEIKKIRGKYTEKVTVQEEEIRHLKAELKRIGKEFTDAAGSLSLYEEKFGAEAVALDEKERKLEEARDYLSKFHKAINAANIQPDDPERLLVLLKVVVQNHQIYWRDNLYLRYKFALDDLEAIK